MKSLCIIPARSGSKRILKKNIKPFMGKPIIAYSIEAALKSNLFDEIMVSTDSEEFAEIAKKYGAHVPFLRSEKTANDYASTEDVIFEVLDKYKDMGQFYDVFCCLYSTAPFVSETNLKIAYEKLNNEIDSSFSVVEYSYPIQRSLLLEGKRIRMISPEYSDTRSQDLDKRYHDAGQFYFSKVDAFYKYESLWGPNTEPLILSELEVQDLDTMVDWKLAEMKYELLHS